MEFGGRWADGRTKRFALAIPAQFRASSPPRTASGRRPLVPEREEEKIRKNSKRSSGASLLCRYPLLQRETLGGAPHSGSISESDEAARSESPVGARRFVMRYMGRARKQWPQEDAQLGANYKRGSVIRGNNLAQTEWRLKTILKLLTNLGNNNTLGQEGNRALRLQPVKTSSDFFPD